MKNIRFLIIILIGIMAITKPVSAQTDTLFLDPRFDIEVLLPRLDSLYEIAKSVNPTLKQEAAAMRSAQWAERYMRWIWSQNMSVFYNYTIGSYPLFAYADPLLPQPSALIQIREGYKLGVNLQLSLFDVMGHRGRVNEQKEKAILQKYKRDAESMELKRKLSAFYADMVGYNRLYKGRNEDYLMQLVACQVAEKEYREGTIHMSEYSRQKNVLADAEAAYHESFRFYYSSLVQFEAVLGVPLHTVMIKQKKN